jgi:hypothetical protein
MRTTVSINDELLVRAKKRASDADMTLSGYLEETLRLRLAEPPPGRPAPVELPVSRGGRPRPGVDLTSDGALFEILDDETPAR